MLIPRTSSQILRLLTATALLAITTLSVTAQLPEKEKKKVWPWSDASLAPEKRAELVLQQMTLDEKIALIHGTGFDGFGPVAPENIKSNGGAGYVVGVPRLDIPGIQMADAAYGVTKSAQNGRYSTALPSDLGAAASWDAKVAEEYGALIGRELRAQGYNMSLGGGENLTREPRNGRTFEYVGEDPVLAGKTVGAVMKGLQAQHVIGDLKHYAVNDQESGRDAVNITISKRAAMESDLLAFEIGLKESHAVAVMCSYNRVNGDFACENKWLLTDVLKKQFKFPGFVLSDWGATHSTEKASAAGLDNEEPAFFFYGDAMKQAVTAGKVPQAELDDHVRRILYAEFASGVVDDPPVKEVIDVNAGLATAQHIEEQSIVLLKNQNNVLPLDANTIRKIAVIGQHADIAMVSGGGSAQVDPPGGNAIAPPGKRGPSWQAHIWFPTSPLKSIQAKTKADVQFASGENWDKAAELAKSADVAIVFVHQWESEGMDLESLALPNKQDGLVTAVASANPHTIVVLETGTAVTMPWIDKVAGVVEAWYPGSKGSDAVANVLFGDVNPSAKLPMTFPRSVEDVPHPKLITPPPESQMNWTHPEQALKGLPPFQVQYDEALKVGYKWYDAEKKNVLFPFGFGLSYTTYAYSDLKANGNSVTFTVKNTGKRAGAEIAEVYASLPSSAGEPPKRLVGWNKVKLGPGESKQVTVEVDPHYLQVWDEQANDWKTVAGEYKFLVGPSSRELPLTATVSLK